VERRAAVEQGRPLKTQLADALSDPCEGYSGVQRATLGVHVLRAFDSVSGFRDLQQRPSDARSCSLATAERACLGE